MCPYGFIPSLVRCLIQGKTLAFVWGNKSALEISCDYKRGIESMHVNSMSPDSNSFVSGPLLRRIWPTSPCGICSQFSAAALPLSQACLKGITQVMIRQELHESFCCCFTGSKWYLIPWVQFLMAILGHSDSATIYQWRDQGHGKPSTYWAKQWVSVTSTVSEIISLILKGGRGCLLRCTLGGRLESVVDSCVLSGTVYPYHSVPYYFLT